MQVHHQKNPQTKKQPHQNPIHAQNPHHGAAERTSSAVEQPLHPAGKQVAQRMRLHHQKNPRTEKTTSQKSNPRAKSHHGAADAPHPRRSNSRSTQQENKSCNECGCITKKNPQTKNLTSQKSHPRDKSPPRSRGCTAFSAGRTAAPTRRKTSRATNAGS